MPSALLDAPRAVTEPPSPTPSSATRTARPAAPVATTVVALLIGTLGVGQLPRPAVVEDAAPALATQAVSHPALDVLAGQEPDLLTGLAGQGDVSLAAGALLAQTAGGTTTVPLDPADPVVLDGSTSHASVGIGLPFADRTAQGEVVDLPGEAGPVAVFDHGNGSSSIPLTRADSSVQLTTVIEGPQAPTEYAYPVDVAGGGTLVLHPEGMVEIRDAHGEFAGAVAKPWARDATGAEVPTSYRVEGDTLIQTVDHAAAGVAYPVVADPWAGRDLFLYIITTRYRYLDQVVVSTRLSTWGWAVYGTQGRRGYEIVRDEGWKELVADRPWVQDRPTMKQQYDCHALFGYALWGAGIHWDMEWARGSNPTWREGITQHRCNW